MDAATVIQVLAWALVLVSGGLVSAITWFALRAVAQIDKQQETLISLDRRIAAVEAVCKLRRSEAAT